jgi:hypothetical protein
VIHDLVMQVSRRRLVTILGAGGIGKSTVGRIVTFAAIAIGSLNRKRVYRDVGVAGRYFPIALCDRQGIDAFLGGALK